MPDNSFSYIILSIIFIPATLQSLLLSYQLFRRKHNLHANRILALFFIFFALELGYCLYEITGLYKIYPGLIGSAIGLPLLYGPLVYYFVYLLGDETRRIKPIQYLTFLPFFIFYIPLQILLHSHSTVERIELILNNFSDHTIYSFLVALIPLYVLVFMVAGILEVQKINKKIKETYSKIEYINLYWLNSFTYGVIAALVSVVFLHFIEHLLPFNIKYPPFILMSAWMFYLGYLTLHQPEVAIHKEAGNIPDEEISQSYIKSALPENISKELSEKLYNLMETDKPYLNPDLKLYDLAAKLETSTHNLSQILNQTINQNFYDFINYYRVEEFKKLIAEDSGQKYSILALAYEAGFASKTSFYTIFKKSTGITPSEYRKTFENK